jgi:hypothetical protein
MACLLISACTPTTRYRFEWPDGVSTQTSERHHKECSYEALKVAASASTEGGAIVYGEKAYITCMELRGATYKGKTTAWK